MKQFFGGEREEVRGGAQEAGLDRGAGARGSRATQLSRGDLREGHRASREGDRRGASRRTTHRTSRSTRQPATRDVRHILVKTKALADDLYAAAQERRSLRGAREEVLGGHGLEEDRRQAHDLPRARRSRRSTRSPSRSRRTQISQPVKTQFGWHIIEALAPSRRRTSRSSRTSSRRSSRSLAQQKKTKLGQDWAEQLRKNLQKASAVKYQAGYQPPQTEHARAPPPAARRPVPQDAGLAEALLDLQQLTERLRRDCPWDREQTARTIVPHTVEEAYEVADAAAGDDAAKLVDELGDLLFQVVLPRAAARGARRRATSRTSRAPSTTSSSAGTRTSSATPRRRRRAACASAGRRSRPSEEGARASSTTCPRSLPALLYARKVQRRAASVGFEYPDIAGPLAEVSRASCASSRRRSSAPASRSRETEPDGGSWTSSATCSSRVVNVARRLNVDPELALRATSARFLDRVERASSWPPSAASSGPSCRSTSRSTTTSSPRRRLR